MHPIESPKVHARVKKAAELLGKGSGKVIVTFDVSNGRPLLYNVAVEFPRESA